MKERRSLSKPIRILLITLGILSLIFGIIGIFLPVWPTTPFLLVSAACFARGSQRFYDWLLNNPLFGEYIRNYREGKGVEKKHRRIALITLWGTILISSIFFVESWWIRAGLLLIAFIVSVHLFKLPTYEKKNSASTESYGE